MEELLNLGISLLEKKSYKEAEKAFKIVLASDKSFSSFNEANELIKKAASEKLPFHLQLMTRKTMLCIGITYAMQSSFKEAEDYVLNSVYSCQDASILLLAGKYYLAIPDVDMDTAFSYFKRAAGLEPLLILQCDDFVYKFVREMGIFHIGVMGYVDLWTKIKDEISEVSEDHTCSINFVQKLLPVFKELDIIGLRYDQDLLNMFT